MKTRRERLSSPGHSGKCSGACMRWPMPCSAVGCPCGQPSEATATSPFRRSSRSPWRCSSMVSHRVSTHQSTGLSSSRQNAWAPACRPWPWPVRPRGVPAMARASQSVCRAWDSCICQAGGTAAPGPQVTMLARGLICASCARCASVCCGVARSVLLRYSRSAAATWASHSGRRDCCHGACSASTTVEMKAGLKIWRSCASPIKVAITGPGAASPVVSISTL